MLPRFLESIDLLRTDRIFIGVFAVLLLMGMITVATTSANISMERHEATLYLFWKQGIALMFGIVAIVVLQFISIKRLRIWSVPFFLFSILLLIVVLLPQLGVTVNGSRRWLRIGGISVQVSEIAKAAAIIYFANFLSMRRLDIQQTIKPLFGPMFLGTLVVLLCFLEPDYGTAVIFCGLMFGMAFLSTTPIRSLMLLGIIVAGCIILFGLQAPYRIERLQSFLDPWQDPLDAGFQLTQALVAYGRGHWFGTGLGNSVQKLFYLPEAHTDFSFAVLAEELGLFGSLLIIFLFWVFVMRIYMIAGVAEKREHYFSAYLAYGVAILFSIQIILNIGINLGLLPTKGLPLPFFSYGGSALVINMVLVGLVLRVICENYRGHRNA